MNVRQIFENTPIILVLLSETQDYLHFSLDCTVEFVTMKCTTMKQYLSHSFKA